ncbi:hypothetical protein SAMN05216349_1181 [Oribacterium sp. KHPX15]|nr:hypothetical protein SAMN05216349_1012 [Oribacterium sp. KHPX15]SEA58492.1 hypothetical protein SAMN05216349_1181 [Oribacterium sp. KHPX15]
MTVTIVRDLFLAFTGKEVNADVDDRGINRSD